MAQIVFTEADVLIVAEAMARSRGYGKLDFTKLYLPNSEQKLQPMNVALALSPMSMTDV